MHTTGSGAQRQADDTKRIRATIAPWNKNCLDRNWDALLAMCTRDIAFSGPGGPRVSGDALRTWLDDFPVQTSMTFDFERIEVSGDLAAAYGSGKMTIVVDGEDVPMSFDFMDMLRKEDGNWLYSSVIFNDKDVPA